jgi:hypothetical protein
VSMASPVLHPTPVPDTSPRAVEIRKGETFHNWSQLNSLMANHLRGDVLQAYRDLLDFTAQDAPDGERTYLGFFRAPAAKGNHHAFEGGLVYHLLEMWNVWTLLRPMALASPYVTDERVLRAILNHDLHKAYLTYVLISADPWQTDYGKHETDELMTNDTKSLWLLTKHHVPMDPEQMNALLWAEGGFSKTRPNWTSVLAKLCYLLDEMSGNVIARIDSRTFLNHRMPLPFSP